MNEAPFDNRRADELIASLYDWLDGQTTARKVFARHILGRSMGEMERLVMREAKLLLDDGRISIISRVTRVPGTAAVVMRVTHVAERVTW